MPRVFLLIGPHNVGKTTLAEKLVRELSGRGLVVGTLKQTSHSYEPDREGKDSYRLFHAGSRVSAFLAGPTLLVRYREWTDPLEAIERHFGDCDVVIAEGRKSLAMSGGLKVELVRRAISTETLCAGDPDVVAVVTDVTDVTDVADVTDVTDVETPHGEGVRRFGFDDVAALASFLLEEAG